MNWLHTLKIIILKKAKRWKAEFQRAWVPFADSFQIILVLIKFSLTAILYFISVHNNLHHQKVATKISSPFGRSEVKWLRSLAYREIKICKDSNAWIKTKTSLQISQWNETYLILPSFFYTYAITVVGLCWMKIENKDKRTSDVRYDLQIMVGNTLPHT